MSKYSPPELENITGLYPFYRLIDAINYAEEQSKDGEIWSVLDITGHQWAAASRHFIADIPFEVYACYCKGKDIEQMSKKKYAKKLRNFKGGKLQRIDREGKVVGTYNGLDEAVELTATPPHTIRECVQKGMYNNGFVWRLLRKNAA